MKTRYIALLRGINLGNRRIKMERLRELFIQLKFTGVETFIASGNVVFDSTSGDAAKVERLIAKHLHESLGYEVDVFVRTRSEFAEVASYRPFEQGDMDNDANTIHVGFWTNAPTAAPAKNLAAIKTDVDEFRVKGREFFWLCRVRSSDSKVWTLPAMRALKLPSATMRNRTTVLKMAELFQPDPGA
jgi:uncharacterized protein (DUF1697 family)